MLLIKSNKHPDTGRTDKSHQFKPPEYLKPDTGIHNVTVMIECLLTVMTAF